MEEYITIRQPAEVEIIIKKSRFIGRLFPVADFEEAQTILERIKKQHWDATHNCSAMIIGPRGEFTRCSDDGEPQGTAGVPMLEALKHSGMTGVLAIVTRYFGGILLGAGGLVRAYTQGVAQAVEAAQKVLVKPFTVMAAELPFRLWGKAESQLLSAGCRIKSVDYTACVQVQLFVQPGREDHVNKVLAELSSGSVIARPVGQETIDIKL
ncbi:MAG: YigZ family protein [Christensenellaceae bacterium]|nr:YigZ family protein [Christensenellaceae bacterium]